MIQKHLHSIDFYCIKKINIDISSEEQLYFLKKKERDNLNKTVPWTAMNWCDQSFLMDEYEPQNRMEWRTKWWRGKPLIKRHLGLQGGDLECSHTLLYSSYCRFRRYCAHRNMSQYTVRKNCATVIIKAHKFVNKYLNKHDNMTNVVSMSLCWVLSF